MAGGLPEDLRYEIHQALQDFVQRSDPEVLGGSALTRWVVLCELMTPSGELAFHRMTGAPDGRPLVTWEVDGLLYTGLVRHRPQLGGFPPSTT